MIEKINWKQIGSILLALFVYTVFINCKAAILLVVAVGFHEQSHLLAAKYLGFKIKDFYLIPFVGGVAFIADRYKYYWQNAFVAIMGPAGGALLAGLTALAYLATGYAPLAAAAMFMCILNGFNLIFVSFLDGGQIMGTITYSINKTFGMVCLVLSTVLGLLLMAKISIVLMVVIGFFGGMQTYNEVKNWWFDRKGQYWLVDDLWLNKPKAMSGKEIVVVIVSYLSLVSLLIGMMILLNKTPDSNFVEVLLK